MPMKHLTQMEAVDEFQQFMLDNGISPPSSIEADGEIHRYYIQGHKSGSKNGSYAFYLNPNGSYGGWVKDFKQGELIFNWSSISKSDYNKLTPEEQQAIKKQREQQAQQQQAERNRKYKHGKANIPILLKNTVLCTTQNLPDYLNGKVITKDIESFGLRVITVNTTLNSYCDGEITYHKGALIIPVFDSEGNYQALQVIYKYKGKYEKRFLKDTSYQGGFIKMGNRLTSLIYICEGWTTGKSIYDATGCLVVVAFNCENLKKVVQIIQTKVKDKEIKVVMACDNDQFKERNAGIEAGKAISQSLGIPYTYPIFKSEQLKQEPTDFNDLYSLDRLEEVKQQLEKNLTVFSQDKETQLKPKPSNKSPLIFTDDRGKKGLLPHSKASRVLKDRIQTLAFDPVTESWLCYKETIWQKITQTEQKSGVDHSIHKLGGQIVGYSNSYVDGVNNLLKGLLIKRFDKEPSKNLLPFKNGVLDLDNKILLPHDPDHLFMWQLPYNYQESSDCQPFTDFLTRCVSPNNDRVLIIRAFINAVITGRSDLQKYLELIGFGGTGKSVLIAVLTALVGSKNCHSTTLKILAKDKFETANLYQKRLTVITDAEKWAGDVAQLKAITGQDPLRYEEKHIQAKGGTFVYPGLIMIIANHHIDTNDKSSGIQRRRLTILFDNVVPKKEIDTGLAEKLSKLAPQIINWALMLDNDSVTDILLDPIRYAPSLELVESETMQATNPIAGWAMDNLEPQPDQKVQIGTLKQYSKRESGGGLDITEHFYHHEEDWLYPNFAQWFNQNNHNDRYSKRISIKEFKRSVIDILRNVLKWGDIKEITINGCRHIKGISIKETETEQSTNKPIGYLSRVK